MPDRASWLLLGALALNPLFPLEEPGAELSGDGDDLLLEAPDEGAPDTSSGPATSSPPALRISPLPVVPFVELLLISPPQPPERGRRARQSARLGGQRPPPEPRPEVES